jgi:hypothetical protein
MALPIDVQGDHYSSLKIGKIINLELKSILGWNDFN